MIPKKKLPFKKESLENKAWRLLKKKKNTLALAESCTGGLISHRITNIPGSSAYFLGSVVCYSNDAKVSLLGVSKESIKKYGAVSRQTALAMAKGVRGLLGAEISAAITGIAGPSGGTKEKPVGLAFIAVISEKSSKTRKIICKGSRESIKTQFADAVLNMILDIAKTTS
ncbi:MAG: CinA family protein [Candidatus Omnitrophica bacterium]|nr:CinA family protein [Candidatus Omnitrophota bacterium]